MSSKKNIDRLFQERFKDFEAAPPMAAWDQIEKNLDGKKPVAVFPLWIKWIGIAASIALIATLVYTGMSTIIDPSQVDEQVVTDVNQQNNIDKTVESNTINNSIENNASSNKLLVEENDSSDSDIIENNNQNNATVASSDNDSANNIASQDTDVNNTTQSTNHKKSISKPSDSDTQKSSSTLYASQNVEQQRNQELVNSSSNTTQKESSNSFAQHNARLPGDDSLTPSQKKSDGPVKKSPQFQVPQKSNTDIAAVQKDQDSTPTAQQPSLEDIAAQQEENEEENTDPIPFKKWNTSSMIAPVYSSTLGGSSIDQQFADNNKSAGVNLSYGVNIGYNVSPRLSVRTGVHSVNMSYTTNDIVYGRQSQPDVQLLSVNSFDRNAVSNPGTTISTDNLGSSFSQEFLADNTFNGFQGEISQRLGYLEVPVEIKYKLLDRKLSVNVMGGMSALFLTDNSIAVSNTTEKLELGEDDNFNSFNQSANFGLGIDYLFTDQLGITVEPMFKYQLNALRENTANFRPFNVGVYSGITYRF